MSLRSMPSFRLTRVAAISILAATSLGAAACASNPKLPPLDAAAHQASWQEWRGKRTTFLSTPGRPMSYTGLTWIRQGATTVGGDSTNMVRLLGRDVPAKVGVLVRTGNAVRFEPAAGALVTVDSQPAALVTLRTDAVPKPSVVSAGTSGFRIMERFDSMGVRTWDSDRVSPEALAKEIGPLEYFALDPVWRIPGKLVRREKPETVAVATSSGVAELHIILGTVDARIGEEMSHLTAYLGTGPTDLYFSFSDESSGEDTYGFRFLHAALDTASNIVTLDFNFAYNPDCAFSAFTTCPLPPDGNRIGVRIPVGERAVKYVNDGTGTARAKRLADKVRSAGAVAKPAEKK